MAIKSMILSLVASGWVGAGSDRKTADGQPVRFFVKEIARKGDYVLPKSGEKFTIDDAKLDNWALQHERLVEAGVKVWAPEGHSAESSKNRGWVDSIFREGDSLKARFALVGDGIKLSATSDVSLFSPESWTDGKGNKYDWPILHVALTPTPVLPGLKPFESVEFSHEGRKVDVTAVMFANEGASNMDQKLLELAARLGVAVDGLDEAGVKAAVSAALEEIATLVDAVGGDAPSNPAGDPKAPEAKPPTAVAASHGDSLFRLMAKDRNREIDGLVRDGCVTPATAKKLRETWVSADAKALRLSMDDNSQAAFESTIEALKQNKAMSQPTVKSMPKRLLALSRTDTGGASGDDDDVVGRLLSHVGQGNKKEAKR